MMTYCASARGPTPAERAFCQVAAGLAALAIERWMDEEVRSHLERQLRRAQKMEAVGTLAGGIAHDFNNILTGIFGFVQLAREDLPEGHSAHTWLEEVMAAAMRARDVVRQILTFSRQQEQEVAPCDINAVTEEATKLIRAVLPATIELKMNTSENLPVVKADPVQVHQAMVNLCTNAWHAMPDGTGVITVDLVDTMLPRDGLAMPTELKEGRYVCITVNDNGEGMSPQMMDRIFEPFFTTKPTGKGSGLGLAVVHGIMQAQHGGVLVESEEGKGSTFYLAFPVEESEIPAPPPTRPSIIKGEGETLLLVDDEKPIVGWLRALLKRCGYTVEGFVQPVEAMEAFEADPQRFDIVLTDLTMPGLTGADLARKIKSIRPEVPIILMSGYDDVAAPDRLFEAGVDEVLRKPLMAETLTTALHRVLHSRKG
jgi:signal transduction histidine kinase/ActR/RegA family two-component response regulator